MVRPASALVGRKLAIGVYLALEALKERLAGRARAGASISRKCPRDFCCNSGVDALRHEASPHIGGTRFRSSRSLTRGPIVQVHERGRMPHYVQTRARDALALCTRSHGESWRGPPVATHHLDRQAGCGHPL